MKTANGRQSLTGTHNSFEPTHEKRPSFLTAFQNLLGSKQRIEECKENFPYGCNSRTKRYESKNGQESYRDSISTIASNSSVTNGPGTRFSLLSRILQTKQSNETVQNLPQSNASPWMNSKTPALPEKMSVQSKSKEIFALRNQIINLKNSQRSLKLSLFKNKTTAESLKEMATQKDPINPYYSSIFNHLKSTQDVNRCRANPLRRQTEINKRMRAVLFDWLLKVHKRFDLKLRTFMLIANIFDRYLSCKSVKRNEMQVIGLATLLIASKYEDIYPPELKDMTDLTSNAFSKEHILEAESRILEVLKFDMIFVSPLDSLEVLIKQLKIEDPQVIEFATMVLFAFAFHHFSDKFGPFKLAAFSLAHALRSKNYRLLSEIEEHLDEFEYEVLLVKLRNIVRRLQTDSLSALSDKFKNCYSMIV